MLRILLNQGEIISELISLDTDITNYELELVQLNELISIYNNKLNNLPSKQLEFSKLYRNNVVLNQNYNLLRQKALEEAKINLASQEGKVQIVDYTEVPGQSGVNRKRIILSGIIFGLIFGIGFTLIIEILDNTIKTNHDIDSLTVLGVIPSIGDEISNQTKNLFGLKKWFTKSSSSRLAVKRRLITKEDPRPQYLEAYRSLRTSMLYTGIDKKTKSILVSSAGPGEGKTTTVANMAITYANLEKRLY